MTRRTKPEAMKLARELARTLGKGWKPDVHSSEALPQHQRTAHFYVGAFRDPIRVYYAEPAGRMPGYYTALITDRRDREQPGGGSSLFYGGEKCGLGVRHANPLTMLRKELQRVEELLNDKIRELQAVQGRLITIAGDMVESNRLKRRRKAKPKRSGRRRGT